MKVETRLKGLSTNYKEAKKDFKDKITSSSRNKDASNGFCSEMGQMIVEMEMILGPQRASSCQSRFSLDPRYFLIISSVLQLFRKNALWTHRRTDGRTKPHIEMLGHI